MNAPAFWTSRSAGGRALIVTIAGVAAAALLVAFVWLPVERARSRMAAELPQLRASVAEMRAQAEEAKALRAMPPVSVAAATPLATLVASGTLAQGLPGARVSTLDAKRVRVAVDDAAWSRLLEWISEAGAAHGLVVDEATVEALGAPGRVRASLVLATP